MDDKLTDALIKAINRVANLPGPKVDEIRTDANAAYLYYKGELVGFMSIEHYERLKNAKKL